MMRRLVTMYVSLAHSSTTMIMRPSGNTSSTNPRGSRRQ